MLKKVFVLNDEVISTSAVVAGVNVSSTISGAVEYTTDVSNPVDVGWSVTVTNGVPSFTAPAAVLPKLTPMQFYLAFTPAERIAIKTSTDPVVSEFWATYQLAVQTNTLIDPSLTSVVEGLTYMATSKTATPPGAGILASSARIAQIQAGTPQ